MRKWSFTFVLLALVAGCSGASTQKLHLFTWSDYLDPAIARAFETQTGIHLAIDYYDSNEAMLAKLKAGGAGQYDVVVASDYAVEVMIREGMLEPLDTSKIPNLANLDPKFRGLPFDPQNRFTAAYQWGTTGLGVRRDLITAKGRELDTWRLVFDSTYTAGPFSMLNDERETIGAALIYLGYSPNTTDSTELARAEKLLQQQRPRVTTYAPLANARDLLASGDVVVAHNSSGDIMLAKADAPQVAYVIPREGAIIWTDNLAIPAHAPHRASAEKFINYMLDGEVGAKLSRFTKYATPNAAARRRLEPGILQDRAVYPDSAVMAKLHYLRDLGPFRGAYDRVWTRLRAGG